MAKWSIKNPPKKEGKYLVTIKTNFGKQVRQAQRVQYPKGNWYWYILPGGGNSSDVVAWQKEPKPYEE